MKNSKKSNAVFVVVATDVVCFRINLGQLETLVAKTPGDSPFPGKWALVGGMMRNDETAEKTVTRLLSEKAGIDHIYKEQAYTFSAIDRDPRGRVVSVAYLALTQPDMASSQKGSLETKWVVLDSLPKMAYDHDQIFEFILEKFRKNISETDIARHLMTPEFTLSELQKVHEAVLGKGIDKRNFRKKILSQNILKETKKVKKTGVMRPAKVYRFK